MQRIKNQGNGKEKIFSRKVKRESYSPKKSADAT